MNFHFYDTVCDAFFFVSLVSEVSEECGLTDTASSTDEDEVGVNLSTKSVHKQQLTKRQGVLEISIGPVQDTFAPRPKAMAHVPLSHFFGTCFLNSLPR